MRVVALQGFSGWLEHAERALDLSRLQGPSPAAMALRDGEPVICNDFIHDPRTVRAREPAAHIGTQACARLPLTRNAPAGWHRGVACAHGRLLRSTHRGIARAYERQYRPRARPSRARLEEINRDLDRRVEPSQRRAQVGLLLRVDLKMPRVDGLEVLQRIKSDARLRRIPTVVLTSSREQQDVRRSYELGVSVCVVKPIDSDEFLDTVHRFGAFWVELNRVPTGL